MERRKLLLGSRGYGEGSKVSLRNKIYDGEGGKGRGEEMGLANHKMELEKAV